MLPCYTLFTTYINNILQWTFICNFLRAVYMSLTHHEQDGVSSPDDA